MLIDKFNRKIDYLRVSITDRCNLRCIYCMPLNGVTPKSHDEILRFEETEEIIKIFISLGIKKVRITGGEPLVRKGIIEFIKNITLLDGLEDVSITTNGILLKEYAFQLKNSGIKRINISLDTLNEKKFKEITKTGNLSDVLDGLNEIKKLVFSPIKINVVVIKGINDDEILDFAKLSIGNPYEVRFIEYMPTNNSIGWSEDKFISVEEIKNRCSRLGNIYPVEPIVGAGPAEYFKFKDAIGSLGFISPISNSFCYRCNRLRLTSDGKLKLCLHSPNIIDLKHYLRNKSSYEEIKNTIISFVGLKPEKNSFIYFDNENVMCQVGG